MRGQAVVGYVRERTRAKRPVLLEVLEERSREEDGGEAVSPEVTGVVVSFVTLVALVLGAYFITHRRED